LNCHVHFITAAGTIAYGASPFPTLEAAMDHACVVLNLGAKFVHVVDHENKVQAGFPAVQKHCQHP
jgi:hypothetical protein